jgi:hypothetical protein
MSRPPSGPTISGSITARQWPAVDVLDGDRRVHRRRARDRCRCAPSLLTRHRDCVVTGEPTRCVRLPAIRMVPSSCSAGSPSKAPQALIGPGKFWRNGVGERFKGCALGRKLDV